MVHLVFLNQQEKVIQFLLSVFVKKAFFGFKL